jgi:two-component system sensor histidine kinase KdpD
MRPTRRDALYLSLALSAIAGVTYVYAAWLHEQSAATISTTYLLVVLILAASASLWTAVVASLASVLSFNFFFLPPVGTFTIAEPENWAALLAFLAVSLVASNLSARVRSREQEALSRRDELARLFDLSRDILLVSESESALDVLARSVARRFELAYVAIALPTAGSWRISVGGSTDLALADTHLSQTFEWARRSLEFDAHARAYSGHTTVTIDGQLVHLVPLRSGTIPIGMLAAAGRSIESGTLDALAGICAIAIERARFLDERKAAELTRQSEQLKAALLASISHDLRTPLTAIRLAATNIRTAALGDDERADQADIVLGQTERLARLFQNILEMTRLDAGAVGREDRWTYASEIVAGAREQVEHGLEGHALLVDVGSDAPVQVDPRLTAAALAHILENATQYAPPTSPIELYAVADESGLTLRVRDHGPGLSADDLQHVFERFYRGAIAGAERTSGTGMGLWIARGLVAVQGGTIHAENASGGGALFTLHVPGAVRDTPAATPLTQS